ncbi:hypothetical protein IDJ77_22355 [Mucilaginibacter sp. ZT4R22]|uniref:Uncharacterized protein n=1 Tax=Mucilaginibacter pankratovii TaxID=2772110 RepID=A0ABR7WWK4_9SPHI|nr:hypothetical protein [Mucilaginibacter pankratovii]MBD1366573.1 hypothetical protein [Mucilaginibacter pankratovii]
MLQAFTWQQFLIAALIFSLVWLVVVLLLFYRKEVFAFLSGAKPEVVPLKHAWQDDFEQEPDDDLMGKAAEQEGISVLGQHDFGFAPRVEEPAEDDTSVGGDVLQSDLFDLMEDVKPLFDSELDKAGLIEAVNEEVRRYPRLMDSTLLETFYLMVAEQVQESDTLDFEVTARELQGAL